MSPRPANRVRLYGLVTAAALGLFFVALIGLFVLRTERREELGIQDLEVLGAEEDSGLTVQLTDRETGRLTGELAATRVEPLPNGWSRLVEPAALIFLESGDTLHVRADEGEFLMPGRTQQPESGTLTGDVIVRLYERGARAEGADAGSDSGSVLRPEIGVDAAAVTFRTDAPLAFDLRLLEASTPGRVTVVGSGFAFAGTEMFVSLNEVRERIERLFVQHGEYLTLETGGQTDRHAGGRESDPAGQPGVQPPVADARPGRVAEIQPGGTAAEPQAPAVVREPKVERYSIAASDAVRFEYQGATLTGDRLDAWVRLVDNTLAPDAIASFGGGGGREPGLVGTPSDRTLTEDVASGDAVAANVNAPTAAAEVGDGSPGGVIDDPTETVRGAGPATSLSGAVGMASAGAGEADATDGTRATDGTGATGSGETLRMTWTGPLEIVPVVSGPPAPLEGEEVAVRLVGDSAGRVRASDPTRGIDAVTDRLEYGATTASMVLSGTSPRSVDVVAEGQGRLRAGRVEANAAGGEVRIVGAGELSEPEVTGAEATGAEATGIVASRRVAWEDAGAFRFATDDAGEPTDRLREAEFAGRVRLRDGASSLDSETLVARFVDRGDENGSLAIGAARATGRADRAAVARDGAGAALSGGVIDVVFDEESGEPSEVAAAGGVGFEQGTSTLNAERLLAMLGPDPATGEHTVLSVAAEERVEFADPGEGLIAFSERLEVDVPSEIAVLFGGRSPARVSRNATTIRGPIVRLSEGRRGAFVEGPGEFRHVEPGAGAGGATRVSAVWTDSMSFDDPTGVAECFGDARVEIVTEADASERGPRAGGVGGAGRVAGIDTVSAERVRLELDPGEDGAAIGLPEPTGEVGLAQTLLRDDQERTDEPSAARERGLRRAIAFGFAADPAVPGAKPATLESKRFAMDATGDTGADAGEADGEAVVEQMLYLEGTTIIGDQTRGTLEVPSAGRMLMLDRRGAAETGAGAGVGAGQPGVVVAGGRDALVRMDWAGSMLVDRRAGEAWLEENARVRHKRLSDGEILEIDADRVNASFTAAAEGEEGTPVELRSATARGHVYAATLRGGVRVSEMVADFLRYSPGAGLAEAVASEGNRVTFLSLERPEPISAERLRWDLATGRVEVLRPGVVGLPE